MTAKFISRLGQFIHSIPQQQRIVSRDFGALSLSSFHRFEASNRAGSGLFFILMTFA
jgi:hypothetical protein